MKGIFPSVSLLALAACFFIKVAPPSNVSQAPTITDGYLIGEEASDFTLKNYDGRMVSLSDYKGSKGYIIVFTSNHCPYAEAYENRLISLHNKFARKGYPVIAINPNAPEIQKEDNLAALARKAKEKRFPFPYLSDSLQQVFPRFGADRTPHVFLLDSLKHVRYMGTIDDNAESAYNVKLKYVELAIEALAAGRDPNPAVTKTIGCKIRLMDRDTIRPVMSGR